MPELVSKPGIRAHRGARKEDLPLSILDPLRDKVDEEAALVFLHGKDFKVTPNTFEQRIRALEKQLPGVLVSVSATRNPDNPTQNLEQIEDPSGVRNIKGEPKMIYPRTPAVVVWLRSGERTPRKNSQTGESGDGAADTDDNASVPTDVADLGQDPHVDPETDQATYQENQQQGSAATQDPVWG